MPAPTVVPPARRSGPKEAVKRAAHAVATVAVLPWLLAYWLGTLALGPNRALEGASQALAPLPGVIGIYLRRAFLCRVLAGCDRTAEIGYGVLFSQAGAVIGPNVYVGPRCHLGLVRLERDCLIAAGVHIPSGGNTHFADDPTVPIKDQGGERRVVMIGAGAWVGSLSVVLADVGPGTIVGAGAVVARPLPGMVIAAGVPAKVIRPRFAQDSGTKDEGAS